MRAIVTGHSRGLGAAIAENLLERGVTVLGIARHGNAGLATRFPGLLRQTALDLSKLDALDDWLSSGELAGFVGAESPAILINNAGLLQPIGPLGTQPAGGIAQTVSANVAAPLMLANAFAAGASAAHPRRIVHISSGAARSPYSGWSVYCATKAALDHHARAVAEEARPGLQICSLAPGVVDTDMQGEIRATEASAFPQRERFADLKRSGALARPEHCAAALVSHVLSDAFGRTPVADLRELA
ncbi:SDR family oxidoreductase [Azoarcus sp. L1K30]|uniref:SDR family oxidoreductase n=1 Tax=Azoarcus sp. L1K30 TaxID=2820277 RepID=UPI001B814B1A|nr:SDR family oxidoreductase [Azoarcus sp. L1K30]MBR0567669.1 SDR family oxidoreductase [Azoarcus sp. L1K30]